MKANKFQNVTKTDYENYITHATKEELKLIYKDPHLILDLESRVSKYDIQLENVISMIKDEDSFKDKIFISTLSKLPSDTMKEAVDILIQETGNYEFDQSIVIDIIQNVLGKYKNYKPATLYNTFLKETTEYIEDLKESEGKLVMTPSEFSDINNIAYSIIHSEKLSFLTKLPTLYVVGEENGALIKDRIDFYDNESNTLYIYKITQYPFNYFFNEYMNKQYNVEAELYKTLLGGLGIYCNIMFVVTSTYYAENVTKKVEVQYQKEQINNRFEKIKNYVVPTFDYLLQCWKHYNNLELSDQESRIPHQLVYSNDVIVVTDKYGFST